MVTAHCLVGRGRGIKLMSFRRKKPLGQDPGMLKGAAPLLENVVSPAACPDCGGQLEKESRREIERIVPIAAQPALLTPLCLLNNISYREINIYKCRECGCRREYSRVE